MIKIGDLQASAGQHVFGFLKGPRSRSGLHGDVPVHIFAGAEPGPTLLVQGAVHGGEVIGSIAILRVVKSLDAKKLRGTVIAVPVLNRIGFELGDRPNKIDGKDISTLFPGNPRGSFSDQLAAIYFEEVIRKANAMLDLHAAAKGYERYVLFTVERDPKNPTEIECKRRKLAVAFGLDTAAFFPPLTFGTNKSEEAFEREGIVFFQPEFGGGTGWHENGEANVRDAARGIWNTMRAMRMVDGPFESDGPLCTIYNANVVLWKPPLDGLFVRLKKFGDHVQEGEVYAVLQDPYTGREIAPMRNTKTATVIPSGLEWPTVGATSVGILGEIDEVVDRRTADLYVDFA